MAMAEHSEVAAPNPASELPLDDIAGVVLQQLRRGILVFDRRLDVVRRNQAAEELFGPVNTAGELAAAGKVKGEHVDWVAELGSVLESGTPVSHNGLVFVTEANVELLLDSVCLPLTVGDNSEAVGVILAVEDVTSRASLERRLAVSERMAAVGKLAARVAHELNNPLDGILRYINLSLRRVQPDSEGHEKVVEYLTESRKGLMRMAHIVGELLEFSRSSSAHFDDAGINATIEEAIRAMQGRTDQTSVTIAAVFRSARMPVLRGDMLFQVSCNLIKNAIDAMPDGGRLTITTAVIDSEVVLRFEDTGVGLPEDIDAIFEPFFTTKSAGQGTGLGLAICKDYMERLHGRITAERCEPKGSAFTLYIPLSSCVPDTTRRTNP